MAYILTISNSDIEFRHIEDKQNETYLMHQYAPDIRISTEDDLRSEQYVMLVHQVEGGGIPEAPIDGKLYGRKNRQWARAAEPAEVADAREFAQSVADAAYNAGKQDLLDAKAIIDATTTRIDNRLTEVGADLSSRLQGVTGRVAQAELDINTAEGNITLLASTVDGIGGTVTDQGLRLDSAEGTITLHNNRLNAAEGSITVMEQEWDSIGATITTTVATQMQTPGSAIKTGIETVVDGKAGSIVTTAIQTVTEEIDGILEESTSFSQVRQDTNGLKSVVGDATNGLVHDVSALEQTSTEISARVTSTEEALSDGEGGLLNVGEIKVTADEVSSVVTNGDNYAAIIARINAATGESEVLLDASKIYLLGETVAEKLTALEATIGNLTLENALVHGTIESIIDDTTMWQLKSDGTGSLAKGNISWDTDGNATFAGTVTATAGKIGGWDIINKYLHSSFPTTSGNGSTHLSLHPGMEGGQLASNNGIKSYTVVTTGADPAPGTYTHYWLKADGSGEIANGSLTWSKYGDITLSNLNGSVVLSNSGQTLDQLLALVSTVANMFEWDNDPSSSGYGSIRTKRVLDPITGKWTSPSFYTYGEITAGGVGEGGDTPSGALYSLVDVSHSGVNVLRADGTARQNGDALVFNTTQNKWVASPISGCASSFAQLTGSPYDNTNLATALNGKQNTLTNNSAVGIGSIVNETNVHTVLFGKPEKDSVDIVEYGGLFRFWQNLYASTPFSSLTENENLVLGITPSSLKHYGYTYNYPTKSGTIALLSDVGTATNVDGGYCSLENNRTNWNFASGQNRITPILNYDILAAGSPGIYAYGYSFMTEYSGFQLVQRGGNVFLIRGIADGDWQNWHELYHTGNLTKATLGLGNVDNTADANKSVAYATSAGYAGLLLPKYDGGQQVNPQTYFSNAIGLRVAMTGGLSPSSYWNDTLWINGYSGSDVPYMCALHFDRQSGSPRAYISSQESTASSYGTRYEFYTQFNCNNTSTPWTCSRLLASAYIALENNNEINAIGGDGLYLNYGNSRNIILAMGGGNVGIGTESPSAKLQISGNHSGITTGDIRGIADIAFGYVNDDGVYMGCIRGSSGYGWIQCTYGPAAAAGAKNLCFNPVGGNVGIGTTSPAYKLDVNGSIGCSNLNANGTATVYGPLVINTRYAENVTITTADVSCYINGYDNDGYMRFYLQSNGVTKWTFNGYDGSFVANGEVTAGSDARWKHNITPVINGIDAIMKLQPTEWEWNSDNHKGSGLVAQSVQSVLPHLVKKDGEGYLHLTYDGLHAYEISALQSHETRIERLEWENKKLKMEIQRLRS